MGIVRTCALISLSALAACGGSDATPDAAIIIIPDAPPDAAPPDAFEPTFDLACIGNAAPTTATANVTLSGVGVEVAIAGTSPTIQASHAATIDICEAACAGADKLDTQVTAATGCPTTGCPFTSAALPTGGTPFDVYLRVTKTGNRTTYVYPASPLTADFANIPALTFTDGVIAALGVAGITQEAGKGNLILGITDCANLPITDTANLELTIKQGGTAVAGTTELSLAMFSPMLAGTFAVFNVPPGVTEIGATYKGMTLRAHDVTVVAGATTASVVRPGY
jgi:hypothetical protein